MHSYNPEQKFHEAEQELFHEADLRLSLVGLNLESLRTKERVLDLGAGLCHIERAARRAGLTNVFSAGKEAPRQIESEGLNFQRFDLADGMPYENNFFDEIIVRKGPFFLTTSKGEAVNELEEVLRVLSVNGEARINPVRFGFVKSEMFEKYPKYADINGKAREHRNIKELAEWKEYNLLANRLTQERLANLGYNFSVEESNAPVVESDDYGYLKILKSKNLKSNVV